MRTSIAGKAAEIIEPAKPARFAVIYLHSEKLESLDDIPVLRESWRKRDFAVCAPFGGKSWWSNRVCLEFDGTLTAERHVVDNVLPWVCEHWKIESKSVALVGIGMGGQGAIRIGLRYPELFSILAGITSDFDHYERIGLGTPLDAMYARKEQCRQDGALLSVKQVQIRSHIWFACDPAIPQLWRGNDRMHEKLNALGIEHHADLDSTKAGDEKAYIQAMAEPMTAFLVRVFEQNARRLL